MSHGSSSRIPRKPKKPYATFPLTPHASGKWMKKIRGQTHYFGAWARRIEGVLTPVEGGGWKEALEEYKKVADDLHAGRTPRVTADGLLVKDLANKFLTAKMRKVEAGEMTAALFADYKTITDLVVNQFGADRLVDDLASDDFAALRAVMAKRWGPVRLANSITRTKSVFKYGYDAGLLEKPVRYGPEFAKPDKGVLRRHKAKGPVRMFSAEELRAMIDGALVVGESGPEIVKPDPATRAMILLGLNGGLGNTDVSELTYTSAGLVTGWVNFPRPKTGVPRRFPLWPETLAAINAALEVRPKPAGPADTGRVFLSERGTAVVVHYRTGGKKDLPGIRFTTLAKALGLHRPGVGFYTLRHVFETVGGGAKDQVAVDAIMGHVDHSMAGHYREGVEDDRLRAVVEHVRRWLWPLEAAEKR